MKRINFKVLIITVVVCLLPMILGILTYNRLPDEIAIHFGYNNSPNNFASKNFAVFGIPMVLAFIQLICCILNDISNNQKENQSITLIIKWIIPIIGLIVYSSIILYALGNKINMQILACMIVGIVMIILGMFFPKSNKKEEEKLNKYLKYIFIIFGLFWIISAFLDEIISAILLIGMILLAIGIFIYQFIVLKKSKNF